MSVQEGAYKMTSRIATANRKLNPAAHAIIAFIQNNEEATRDKLYINLNGYSIREIRAGIRILQQHKIIKNKPNLIDMRRVYYILASS